MSCLGEHPGVAFSFQPHPAMFSKQAVLSLGTIGLHFCLRNCLFRSSFLAKPTHILSPSLPPSLHHRTCVALHFFFVLRCDLIARKCLREICHQCLHPLIPAWKWCTPSGQCQASVSSAHLFLATHLEPCYGTVRLYLYTCIGYFCIVGLRHGFVTTDFFFPPFLSSYTTSTCLPLTHW